MTFYVAVYRELDRSRVRQIETIAERLGAADVFELTDPNLPKFIDAEWVPLEVTRRSTPLREFEHPEDAAYILGPQIGSLPAQILRGRTSVIVETGLSSRSPILPTPVVAGIVLHHRLMQAARKVAA